MKEADYVEKIGTCPVAHPSPMEPHVCVAQWETFADKITMWSSSQAPFKVREALAKTLKMDLNNVRVIKMTTGVVLAVSLKCYPWILRFVYCLKSWWFTS